MNVLHLRIGDKDVVLCNRLKAEGGQVPWAPGIAAILLGEIPAENAMVPRLIEEALRSGAQSLVVQADRDADRVEDIADRLRDELLSTIGFVVVTSSFSDIAEAAFFAVRLAWPTSEAGEAIARVTIANYTSKDLSASDFAWE